MQFVYLSVLEVLCVESLFVEYINIIKWEAAILALNIYFYCFRSKFSKFLSQNVAITL